MFHFFPHPFAFSSRHLQEEFGYFDYISSNSMEFHWKLPLNSLFKCMELYRKQTKICYYIFQFTNLVEALDFSIKKMFEHFSLPPIPSNKVLMLSKEPIITVWLIELYSWHWITTSVTIFPRSNSMQRNIEKPLRNIQSFLWNYNPIMRWEALCLWTCARVSSLEYRFA